ncbi:membrane protein insertase YidC [Altererythrobacter sp. BO-6]|uniref:membrane protein insertase YidC n=1 Tax=Altererythrobacter sp. BO-6 TaxID=2604537 RepID=UPI0013E15007|nr:membrane protein insertase YidC [Altererythrobacter sp. BO-6]QIG53912.1 membrane protein insertase YidC [Altererythrobacter sp. BO-6]
MDNQRNLLLAVALSGLLILGWDMGMRYFYPAASLSAQADTVATSSEAPPPAATSAAIGDGAPVAAQAPVDLDAALASPERVRIDAPRVEGSINLVGARLDDIELKDHRETVKQDSRPVQLFAPQGTPGQYFAEFGFLANGQRLPDNIRWQASGDLLSPATPVTLTHQSEDGLSYSIKLSIDDNYMIDVVQTVANTGEGGAVVQPFGLINRTSTTASPSTFNAHSGPMGAFGETVEYGPDYDDLADEGTHTPEGGAPDWFGFSDIYWLSALIPGDQQDATPGFRSLGNDLYRSDLIYAPQTVAPGASITRSTRLFAGAKESVVLDRYRDTLGIENFGKAIDWGWFEWFVKPMVWLLRTLYEFAGNFGVAIILLTVIIRGIMFPIAQKQFASMAAMKAVQPKMKAIQERYKDDKQRQQQEIMKLYKDEKVNPLAGCLPLLIQIPIFFALYKALILAIEMRHKPFVLWIEDLSAPDPAKILNLFGLLPFDPPGFLGIGILAVLLGITMWLTFRLNPTAMDPVQQQIFAFMPWILMFVMAPFAAGLLLYWVTSNLLTLAQQSYLYSKHPQLRAQADKDKADQALAEKRKG